MEPGHLLHSVLTHPSSTNNLRLKSRHQCVPATQQLISSSDKNNVRVANQWNAECTDSPTRLHIFSPTLVPTPHSDLSKSLGPAKPPPHWFQTFLLLLVQMGYGLLSGL